MIPNHQMRITSQKATEANNEKIYEAQFLINFMLKDEIKRKKTLIGK